VKADESKELYLQPRPFQVLKVTSIVLGTLEGCLLMIGVLGQIGIVPHLNHLIPRSFFTPPVICSAFISIFLLIIIGTTPELVHVLNFSRYSRSIPGMSP
jgi:hypothetical protein